MSTQAEAIAAFEEVKQAIQALRDEYDSVRQDIAATQARLAVLPNQYLPLDDLKAAILDYVDQRGSAYAEESVRSRLSDFATHGMSGLSGAVEAMGLPLNYQEISRAMAGQGGPYWAQLLTSGDDGIKDASFYYFFGDLVKAGLAKILDVMSPSEFGYNRISPDQIGSDRATRETELATLTATLAAQEAHREEVVAKLAELGVRVQ
jgi:hypothetical protein